VTRREERRPGSATEDSAGPKHAARRAWNWGRSLGLRPAILLVGGVSIYLLLPSLLAVFGSWRALAHLDWPFAILALACEAAAFVSLWELDRIALHTSAWFPVATAQLSGNAAGRVFPGGGATSTAVSATMLRHVGFDTGESVAAFGAASALQIGTALALPILALPAILGGVPINHNLAAAAYLGIAVLLLLVACTVAAFASDKPLELVGRLIERVLNATVRRHNPVTGLPQELLADRDSIRTALGTRWKAAVAAAVGNTAFDYFALLAALRAVGAAPRPSLVLLAYSSAELLSFIPFTPGGLGFVEAGLVATLTLAGVPGHDAVTATLLYRIVQYWLPLPAGGVAYLLFRHRYLRSSSASS
jgi:uncharacterized protein (TIRG00374 family)